jgi:ParB-like chromosome segregation protein Spo0J
MDSLNLQKIPLEKLNPAAYNPRKDLQPGDAEYEKLLASIEEFGYVDPIIWNKRTGNVVGGHQRLKILIHLGYTEIDVVVVDLDELREKALNVALNKIQGE